jgi:hypothetical protein
MTQMYGLLDKHGRVWCVVAAVSEADARHIACENDIEHLIDWEDPDAAECRVSAHIGGSVRAHGTAIYFRT